MNEKTKWSATFWAACAFVSLGIAVNDADVPTLYASSALCFCGLLITLTDEIVTAIREKK